jgi:VIT1/CCC1 family predicted Fe2+/Mn2+ transporter
MEDKTQSSSSGEEEKKKGGKDGSSEEEKSSRSSSKSEKEKGVELNVSGGNAIESRRKKARKAVKENNVPLSMQLHQNVVVGKEKHKKGADYLKSIIYGGMDGLMTCLAVVTAAAGANLGYDVILILGIARLISNAIAMGIGDFISEKAEIDYAKAEKKREEWEYDHYPKGEIDEMIEIYEKKGMKVEDAKHLVEELCKYKDVFIDTMMVEEVGVIAPDPSDSPLKMGLVTAISFVICGIFPLFPFMVGIGFQAPFWDLFIASCIMTGVMMFVLGAVTSMFTILPWWKGGLYMFGVGAIGSVVSYLIGWGIEGAVGYKPHVPVCNCTLLNTTVPL